MIPPFAVSAAAVSAAAPANKVGPGGPHKEQFTIVSDGGGAKNAAAAAGKARAEKLAGKKPAGKQPAAEGKWSLSVSETGGKFKLNVAAQGGGGGTRTGVMTSGKPPCGHTDFSWDVDGKRTPVGHTGKNAGARNLVVAFNFWNISERLRLCSQSTPGGRALVVAAQARCAPS